uniref:Uncharacterized protein n=1 Tax=Triticum urartu TaxID=4572 RepID=A0A8R7VBE9_TRIUA
MEVSVMVYDFSGDHLYISSSEGDLIAHGEAIQGEESRFCTQPRLPIKGGEVAASMPSALGRWCCASAAGIMQDRWEAAVQPLPPSSRYMIAASRRRKTAFRGCGMAMGGLPPRSR